MATHHLKKPLAAPALPAAASQASVTLPMGPLAVALLGMPGVMEALRAELLDGLFTLGKDEAARALGIGREAFEAAVKAPGGPQPVRIANRDRWQVRELRDWLDSLQRTPGGAAAVGLRRASYERLCTPTGRPSLSGMGKRRD